MATESIETGIVYVLTNPAMPGLVKIGKTSRSSVKGRLRELYSTGVPVPFECVFRGLHRKLKNCPIVINAIVYNEGLSKCSTLQDRVVKSRNYLNELTKLFRIFYDTVENRKHHAKRENKRSIIYDGGNSCIGQKQLDSF